ncbi:hypothetical protein BCL76_10997 [Streptomyces sp. CG 926]|uniref:hypothetical protein n=1 Tax=Streptomyces sp. CG 926 TaxID=1882405 RepID=UPI000D6B8CA1|nr:hypothetical protein [Streptomyces sp. CG 926]PWK67192.1 hypothetical protein BCL76_10997 [Streptomyces sp. CG 926]
MSESQFMKAGAGWWSVTDRIDRLRWWQIDENGVAALVKNADGQLLEAADADVFKHCGGAEDIAKTAWLLRLAQLVDTATPDQLDQISKARRVVLGEVGE